MVHARRAHVARSTPRLLKNRGGCRCRVADVRGDAGLRGEARRGQRLRRGHHGAVRVLPGHPLSGHQRKRSAAPAVCDALVDTRILLATTVFLGGHPKQLWLTLVLQ